MAEFKQQDDFKYTRAYLIKYGNSVEQEIETRLRNHGKYASGKLYDSIRYELKEDQATFTITFKMLDYGQYVDKGIKPSEKYPTEGYKSSGKKSKFITSLQKWCKIKGLPVGLAFPIRRKIWEVGIPPTNFFTIPTRRRVDQLKKGIKKNMALDVKEVFKKK